MDDDDGGIKTTVVLPRPLWRKAKELVLHIQSGVGESAREVTLNYLIVTALEGLLDDYWAAKGDAQKRTAWRQRVAKTAARSGKKKRKGGKS